MSMRRLAAKSRDGAAHRGRVELLEGLAHGAGGAHHHRMRELADIVVEHPVGAQIDGGDRERRGELDLEFVERAQPTERQKRLIVGWLTPALSASSAMVIRVAASKSARTASATCRSAGDSSASIALDARHEIDRRGGPQGSCGRFDCLPDAAPIPRRDQIARLPSTAAPPGAEGVKFDFIHVSSRSAA